MRLRHMVPAFAVAALGGLACLLPAQSAQIYREGFEGKDPLWVQGAADANFKETVHRITDEHANLGEHSEQIQVQTEAGTYIYYYFDTPRTPIGEDTLADLTLK